MASCRSIWRQMWTAEWDESVGGIWRSPQRMSSVPKSGVLVDTFRDIPVRPSGWDLKDQWRARWMSAATVWTDEPAYRRMWIVLLHATGRKVLVVCALVLPMFVSESIQITDDIWDFCRLFGSAPYCYHVLTNLFGTLKNLTILSKMVDLIGSAPNGTHLRSLCDMIKQIRVLVAFMLQPEMKPPKIVPGWET